MKERRLSLLVALLCCGFLLSLSLADEAETSADQQSALVMQARGNDVRARLKAQLQDYKNNNRWYIDLPPFIYNMCALYYVVPDCVSEMFGEEFDVSSMLEEICPL